MTDTIVVSTITTQTPLTINKRESFTLTFPVVEKATKQQISATGFTAIAQVVTVPGDVVLFEWSEDAGNLACLAEGVRLTFDGAITELWDWEQGQFELDLDTPAGPGRLAEGPFFAAPSRIQTS